MKKLRSFSRFLFGCWLLISSVQFCSAQSLTSLDAGVDDAVTVALPTSDGGMLIGGNFEVAGGHAQAHLAKLVGGRTLDSSFLPELDGAVFCAAELSDGSLLIGGDFLEVGGQSRAYLAKLSRTGGLQPLDLQLNGKVYSIVVKSDGGVVIGGQFTSVAGEIRNRLARIDAQGVLDEGFNPHFDAIVYSVTELASGDLVVAGAFENVSGVVRNRLASLSAAGVVDATFAPNADGTVFCVASQADGRILVGGEFNNVAGRSGGGIARLNADGSADLSFATTANNSVESISIQADGGIIVGGQFTNIGGIVRNRVAKLRDDGALDAAFDPNANWVVHSVALDADGEVLTGGGFTYFGNERRTKLARFSNATAVSQSLSVTSNSQIDWQRGGSATELLSVTFEVSEAGLLSDQWTELGEAVRVDGGWRLSGLSLPDSGFVRARGRAASGWFNGSSQLVEDIVSYGNGDRPTLVLERSVDGAFVPVNEGDTIDVGNVDGSSPSYGRETTEFRVRNTGSTWLNINRVELVGSGADGFQAYGVSSDIQTGGSDTFTLAMTAISQGQKNAVLRIWSDDYEHSPFTVNVQGLSEVIDSEVISPNGLVVAMAPLSDGGMLLGGSFSSAQRNGYSYGVRGVARIGEDGKLDSTFNPNVDNGVVYCIQQLPDGKCLIGGSFTSIGGVERLRIARLNADGSLDLGYNPGADGTIYSLNLQPNDSVLVTGNFSNIAGSAQAYAARLGVEGTFDAGFSVNVNAAVNCSLLASDGSILLGGSFTTVNGSARVGLCRVSSAGVLDTSFDAGFNNAVKCLAQQVDGKFIVGGYFTSVGGYVFERLVRLDEDGSLDFNFQADLDDRVTSLCIQADGRIWVAGDFDVINGHAQAGVARLLANGSLDGSFSSGFATSDDIYGICLDAEGSLSVGGDFSMHSSVEPSKAWSYYLEHPVGEGASYQFTSSSQGELTWQSSGSGPLLKQVEFQVWDGSQWQSEGFASQSGGSWTMSGLSISEGGWAQAVGRTTGGYNSSSSGEVVSVGTFGTLRPDIAVNSPQGTELQSGSFVSLGEEQWLTSGEAQVVTVQNTGSADLTGLSLQLSGANAGDFELGELSAPTLAAGESATFTVRFSPSGGGSRNAQLGILSSDYDEREFVVRLQGSGIVPPENFTPSVDGSVRSSLVLEGGRVLVSGTFSTINDEPANGLALLLEDGSLDSSFSTVSNGAVWGMAEQQDGKIVLVGDFTEINGQQRKGIARINPDGSLDDVYDPHSAYGGNVTVSAVALQDDDKVLCRSVAKGGVVQLTRLHTDGSVDHTFSAPSITSLSVLSVQSDGKILVGSSPAGGLVRLLQNGALDNSFSASVSFVQCLSVQADGKIVIAGNFTQVGGLSRNYMARLESNGAVDMGYNPNANGFVYAVAAQANGKLIVGGQFTQMGGQGRQYIAKLNSDGSVDMSFDPSASSTVFSVNLLEDGRVIAGGQFSSIQGTSQTGVARIPNSEVAGQQLTVVANNEVRWQRSGAIPASSRVNFELWGGSDWQSLGTPSYVAGEWVLDSLSLPAAGWVRARALLASGYHGGNSSISMQKVAFGNVAASSPKLVLSVADSALEDGDVVEFEQQDWLTASAAQTLSIQNQGSVALSGLSYTLSGSEKESFQVSALITSSLAAGESTDLDLSFLPKAGGILGAELVIFSNDPANDAFKIVLRGGGMHRDLTFYPQLGSSTNDWVNTSATMADASLIVAGDFDDIDGDTSISRNLSRFDALGQHGNLFSFPVEVRTVATLADGSVVAGGLGNWLRRYDAEGVLDADFISGITNIVRIEAIFPLEDGRFLVGGDFGTNKLQRLNSDGSIDGTFQVPAMNNRVTGIVRQPDGKLVITGLFTTVAGQTRNRVARLLPDGALDVSFVPDGLSQTNAVLLQNDGKLLIAGYGGVRRLFTDGSQDTSFDVSVSNAVRSMVLQSDGKLIIVGSFTSVNGVERSRIARLHSDGSLDVDFDPRANGQVESVMLQPDGSILVGGQFTRVGGVLRASLAQLPNNVVATEAAVMISNSQVDWQLGGSFPELLQVSVEVWNGSDWVFETFANKVAGGWRASGLSLSGGGWLRLVGRHVGGGGNASSGVILRTVSYGTDSLPVLVIEDTQGSELTTPESLSVDFGRSTWPAKSHQLTFTLRNSGTADLTNLSFEKVSGNASLDEFGIGALAVNSLAAGESTSFTVQHTPSSEGERDLVVKLNHSDIANQTSVFEFNAEAIYQVDNSLAASAVDSPRVLHYFTDGSYLMGGGSSPLSKFKVGGELDDTFSASSNSIVESLVVLEGGKIIVAGSFTTIGGGAQKYLARLHPDGSLDNTFAPDINNRLEAVVLQRDGKLLVCGQFTTINGVARNYCARLEADGSLDTSFDANPNGMVYSMLPMEDRGVFIAGSFTTVGGQSRSRVARVDSSGAVNPSFGGAVFNNVVYCLAIDSEGYLLAGGAFSTVQGTSCPGIARLGMDGALDTNFASQSPITSGSVFSMAPQANGQILVAGQFSYYDVALGSYRNLIRLSNDGSLDPLFNPEPANKVDGVRLKDDGSIVITGTFGSVAGVDSRFAAELENDAVPSRGLSVVDGEIQWSFSGSHPVVSDLRLESWDGAAWVTLDIVRNGSGWTTTDAQLASRGWVRALGRVRYGFANRGSDFVEDLQTFGATAVEDVFVEVDGSGELAAGTELSFTNQFVGASGSGRDLVIRNVGGTALENLSLTVSGDQSADFSVSTLAVSSLVPGESTQVSVAFAPTAVGTRTAVLSIQSSDADESDYQLQLIGEGNSNLAVSVNGGATVPTSFSLDLGNVNWLEDSALQTITLTNIGSSTVTGLSHSVTGSHSSDFTLSTLSENSLAVGEEVSFTIKATASGAGNRSAVLELQGSDFGAQPFTIDVRYLGVHEDGTVDTRIDGRVYTLASINGGGAYVAGSISGVDGTVHKGLVKLRSDGTAANLSPSQVNGSVNTMVIQPDGKVLVGGYFTAVSGQARTHLARLNADGTLDPSFAPAFNNSVAAIALQADGKILVGGYFTSVSGVTRNRIVRLESDGAVDSSYDPNLSSGVSAIAVQSDGKVIIGGYFSTIGGVSQPYLARLESSGSLDTSYTPVLNSGVSALAFETDGSLVVAGNFSSVNGTARSRLARLSNAGVLDSNLDASFNGAINSLALAADGMLYVGGSFSSVDAEARSYLCRLLADGSLDPEFSPGADGQVYALMLAGDGSLFVGGSFSTLGGVERHRVARIPTQKVASQVLTATAGNQLDWQRSGHVPAVDSVQFEVWNGSSWQHLAVGNAVAGGWRATGLVLPSNGIVRARGRCYAGRAGRDSGWLSSELVIGSVDQPAVELLDSAGVVVLDPTQMVDFGDAAGVVQSYVLRNDGTGSLTDLNFQLVGQDAAHFNLVAPSVSTLAPGESTSFTVEFISDSWGNRNAAVMVRSNDVARTEMAIPLRGFRGGVDPEYTLEGASSVYGAIVLDDGRTVYAQSGKVNICAIDGTVQHSILAERYTGGFNGRWVSAGVYGVAELDGDSMLAFGQFTRAHGNSNLGYLVKFNSDGSVDEGFDPNVNNLVNAVAVQPDGKILIAGSFTYVDGVTRNYLARLHANGQVDASFDANVNSQVSCVAVQPDGKIVIGGGFSTVGGQARNRIARLLEDGSLDSTFDPQANSTVRVIAVQGDQLLVAGFFSEIGGVTRNRIARLNEDGSVDTSFEVSSAVSPTINSIAALADGSFYVGGTFNEFGGVSVQNIALCQADGSVDAGFTPAVSGSVQGLMALPNGRLLVAGSISSFDGVSVPKVAKLLPVEEGIHTLVVSNSSQVDWTPAGDSPELLDVEFEYLSESGWEELGKAQRVGGIWRVSNVQVPTVGWVRISGRVSGGYVNGSSQSYQIMESYGLVDLPDITVEDTHGESLQSKRSSVDFGSLSGTSEEVAKAFTIRNDGSALLDNLDLSLAGYGAGDYRMQIEEISALAPGEELNFNVYFSPQQEGVRNAVLSISSNDGDEQPFEVSLSGEKTDSVSPVLAASNRVRTVLPLSDGSHLIGGNFTTLGGESRVRIARIMATGDLDVGFSHEVNGEVFAMAELDDGGVLIGGSFDAVNGVYRPGLAKFDASGSLDLNWTVNVHSVQVIRPLSDGRLLIAGDFTLVNGVDRQGVALLDGDGELDFGFVPPTWLAAQVKTVVQQADGKWLLGGAFSRESIYSGQDAIGVIRLNTNGSIDTSLEVDIYRENNNPVVDVMTLMADGKLLISGTFEAVNGERRWKLASLHAGGSLDSSMQLDAGSSVSHARGAHSLIAQRDGGVLLAGEFTSIGSASRQHAARILATGEVGANFGFSINQAVQGLSLSANGTLSLVGDFTELNGMARERLYQFAYGEGSSSPLSVIDGSRVYWQRAAGAPLLESVTFQMKDNGSWVDLGAASRVLGGWEIKGLALPLSGEVRAIGRSSCGYGNGSSLLVREAKSYMPRSLELYYAASLEAGLTDGAAHPAVVNQADGVANLLKYAFNMNLGAVDRQLMEAGGIAGLPNYSMVESAGSRFFKIEFVRRKGSELVYTPMKSGRLGAWVELTSPLSIVDIDAEWERVIYIDRYDPELDPRSFYRVEIELIDSM